MTAPTNSTAREIGRPRALLRDLVLIAMADGPCHGYELARALGDWRRGMAQIYGLLRQLEATGLLRSEWEYPAVGPSRRIYSLTPSGKGAVRECRAGFRHLATLLDRYRSRHRSLRRSRTSAALPAADAIGGHAEAAQQSRCGLEPRPAVTEGRVLSAPATANEHAVRRYLEALEAMRSLPPTTGVAPGSGDSLARVEAAFISVARIYSESEGITLAAWQEEGVDTRVLQAASLEPVRARPRSAPALRSAACPNPLLRCWLLLLVAETPCHGYGLCDALSATVGPVNRARVYRLLHRLHEDGLVASHWHTSMRPAPDQRVYSLTPTGEEALDECATCVGELLGCLRSRSGIWGER